MGINVSLTPELEEYISAKVRSGNYRSASEVVREGLRLLKHADDIRVERLAVVRERIENGWVDSEKGRVVSPESVVDEVRQRRNRRA